MAGARLGACALALGLGLSGCGGESEGGGGCGAGDPCGGDVVGAWALLDLCMDTSGLELSGFDESECAGAMQAPQVSATGTYEFRADGTMSFDVTMSMQMSVVLGAACFEALGGVELTSASCLELEAAMNDPSGSDPGSSIESVSCAFSGGACRCSMQQRPQVLQGDGPYTLQGTSFVDPDGDTLGYCVSGDTLRLYPPDSSGISGTIVLGRQ